MKINKRAALLFGTIEYVNLRGSDDFIMPPKRNEPITLPTVLSTQILIVSLLLKKKQRKKESMYISNQILDGFFLHSLLYNRSKFENSVVDFQEQRSIWGRFIE